MHNKLLADIAGGWKQADLTEVQQVQIYSQNKCLPNIYFNFLSYEWNSGIWEKKKK